MRIILNLCCYIFITSSLFGKDALVTYFGAHETQIVLQNAETGKIIQRASYDINTLKAFYHVPSQKLIFFTPTKTEFNVYVPDTNTLLKVNTELDVDFIDYFEQKDLFIAQNNQNLELSLLKLSFNQTPQFDVIHKIPFAEKLISSFQTSDNKLYFLTSHQLYLFDFEKNDPPHKLYTFTNNNFYKIISVLSDHKNIFLQEDDQYVQIDLSTQKIKDIKNGFLVSAETPDIIFMSHKGEQNKNLIIYKKTRNSKQNPVENPAEKIYFTPDYKNIYFLTHKNVKLYQFNENRLIHKFSFSKNSGQINVFFR